MKYQTYQGWFVYQNEPFTNNTISLYDVIDKISLAIPLHIRNLVDGIYVQYTDEMRKRNINAMYSDRVIYLSSEQSDNQDIYDDIIHELAHATEQQFGYDVYFDGRVEQEYMAKKVKLGQSLEVNGYELPEQWNEIEFCQENDDFLFKRVGYEILEKLCNGLFINAYSCTSINEYWATAFEKYLSKATQQVLCPVAFEKIEMVLSSGEN